MYIYLMYMNENIIIFKHCCSKKSLQDYRKHVNRKYHAALKKAQKTFTCMRKIAFSVSPT